ncbi:unnamed protein product [Spirodela intermedia]|uniref:Uncharacterized protein n=1 Tax=Spirodela intermedia TaxID=51605 RepID=A0A7I8LA79_SPIIN|nr:unnamed protein product [Spirodela intermedia]
MGLVLHFAPSNMVMIWPSYSDINGGVFGKIFGIRNGYIGPFHSS